MKKLSNLFYFVITFFSLTFVNIYSSHLIYFKLLQGWHFENSIFKIVYIENTGAAFSLMQNYTKVLISLSFVALFVMFYYIIRNINSFKFKDILFWSFLISGIIGNLYERFCFGYVRDYFDLSFISFPIFNISDIFINIGVFGIIILILLSKKSFKI